MAHGVYNWKHGWIPLTASAMRQKNHGRTPKTGTRIVHVADRSSGRARMPTR